MGDRQRESRIRLGGLDWVAIVLIVLGVIRVANTTLVDAMSAGDIVVALAVLAGAFIVRAGLKGRS